MEKWIKFVGLKFGSWILPAEKEKNSKEIIVDDPWKLLFYAEFQPTIELQKTNKINNLMED